MLIDDAAGVKGDGVEKDHQLPRWREKPGMDQDERAGRPLNPDLVFL